MVWLTPGIERRINITERVGGFVRVCLSRFVEIGEDQAYDRAVEGLQLSKMMRVAGWFRSETQAKGDMFGRLGLG